jgi:hypothetical protein
LAVGFAPFVLDGAAASAMKLGAAASADGFLAAVDLAATGAFDAAGFAGALAAGFVALTGAGFAVAFTVAAGFGEAPFAGASLAGFCAAFALDAVACFAGVLAIDPPRALLRCRCVPIPATAPLGIVLLVASPGRLSISSVKMDARSRGRNCRCVTRRIQQLSRMRDLFYPRESGN